MPLLHAEHFNMLVWFHLEQAHPEAAIRASYDAEREAGIMTCATCEQASLTITVARQPRRPKDAP
jgi:hypothetical protein